MPCCWSLSRACASAPEQPHTVVDQVAAGCRADAGVEEHETTALRMPWRQRDQGRRGKQSDLPRHVSMVSVVDPAREERPPHCLGYRCW